MAAKNEDLGKRILQVREALGKSQREFAAAMNASFRALQDYEAGMTVPGGKALEGLARLGVNVNWILTGSGSIKTDEPVILPPHEEGLSAERLLLYAVEVFLRSISKQDKHLFLSNVALLVARESFDEGKNAEG